MLTAIDNAVTRERDVSLFVLQDHAREPVTRGNKRFKLQPNLAAAVAQGYSHVLGFGGAFSNHIHALAWSARECGLQSIGIIRGEALSAANATLRDAAACGMQLEFVSRAEYRRRNDAAWLLELGRRYAGVYIIPEGGANLPSIHACRGMLDSLDAEFLAEVTCVACAIGTGATACGLSLGLHATQAVRGYSVVADPERSQRMRQWQAQLPARRAQITQVEIKSPRYGQLDDALCAFIDRFYLRFGVLPDPLYTGKMLRQLMQDIEAGVFPANSVILAMHTGGLQGWRGFLSRSFLSQEPEWPSGARTEGSAGGKVACVQSMSMLSARTLTAVRQQSNFPGRF